MTTNTCIGCAFATRTSYGVIKCLRFPYPKNADDFSTRIRYRDAISVIKNNNSCQHFLERKPEKSLNILHSSDDDTKCFFDTLDVHEWQ